MSAPTGPRTIDNLGPDASIQYAESQKNLDITLLPDSQKIPGKTAVDATTSTFLSQTDILLETQKETAPFATMNPAPKGFYDQKNRLFVRDRLIPSLGEPELRDAKAQKVKSRVPPEPPKTAELKLSERWEEVQERKDEEHEQKSLLDLFSCINLKEKDLIHVNNGRNQYKPG